MCVFVIYLFIYLCFFFSLLIIVCSLITIKILIVQQSVACVLLL